MQIPTNLGTLIQQFLAFLNNIHTSVWEYPFSSKPSLPNAPQIHIWDLLWEKKKRKKYKEYLELMKWIVSGSVLSKIFGSTWQYTMLPYRNHQDEGQEAGQVPPRSVAKPRIILGSIIRRCVWEVNHENPYLTDSPPPSFWRLATLDVLRKATQANQAWRPRQHKPSHQRRS